MAGEDKEFDANEFEKKQHDAAQKAKLQEVVGKQEREDGTTVDVTQLDAISHHWRQTATQIVRLLDPDAYKKYREMKYAGGDNPTLGQRKSAYKFIIRRFLDLTYTKAGV